MAKDPKKITKFISKLLEILNVSFFHNRSNQNTNKL